MFQHRPRGVLVCTFCGREIVFGEEYWVCNGCHACTECLSELARLELAPCHEIRGEEETH